MLNRLMGSHRAAGWKRMDRDVESPGRGRPSPAAEPVVSPDPFCGDTPQRPESESADRFVVTG
jgi:hypothetical protein